MNNRIEVNTQIDDYLRDEAWISPRINKLPNIKEALTNNSQNKRLYRYKRNYKSDFKITKHLNFESLSSISKDLENPVIDICTQEENTKIHTNGNTYYLLLHNHILYRN